MRMDVLIYSPLLRDTPETQVAEALTRLLSLLGCNLASCSFVLLSLGETDLSGHLGKHPASAEICRQGSQGSAAPSDLSQELSPDSFAGDNRGGAGHPLRGELEGRPEFLVSLSTYC